MRGPGCGCVVRQFCRCGGLSFCWRGADVLPPGADISVSCSLTTSYDQKHPRGGEGGRTRTISPIDDSNVAIGGPGKTLHLDGGRWRSSKRDFRGPPLCKRWEISSHLNPFPMREGASPGPIDTGGDGGIYSGPSARMASSTRDRCLDAATSFTGSRSSSQWAAS